MVVTNYGSSESSDNASDAPAPSSRSSRVSAALALAALAALSVLAGTTGPTRFTLRGGAKATDLEGRPRLNNEPAHETELGGDPEVKDPEVKAPLVGETKNTCTKPQNIGCDWGGHCPKVTGDCPAGQYCYSTNRVPFTNACALYFFGGTCWCYKFTPKGEECMYGDFQCESGHCATLFHPWSAGPEAQECA
mmetsp:Transcript_31226/g.96444  ORF Transcript_31226/g.96444 Transcript_31226/m.96444 type:complete len:192 (+) Transcript_31226:56-631(+)